jgi:hypothetical protein
MQMWMGGLAMLVLVAQLATAQDRLDAVTAAADRAMATPQAETAGVDRMAKLLGTPPETLRAERASTKLGWGDLFVAHRIATRGGHPIDKVFSARRTGAPWSAIAEEAGVQPDVLVGDVATVWPDAARPAAPADASSSAPAKPPPQATQPSKSPADGNAPFQPFGDSPSSDRTRDEIRDRMIRGGGSRY